MGTIANETKTEVVVINKDPITVCFNKNETIIQSIQQMKALGFTFHYNME